MSHTADRRLGVVLLAPALVVLATVSGYPVVRVLVLALERRVPIFGIDRVVGVANYRFLAGDADFWNAVRVTVTFAIASVAIEIVLGLAVALAIEAQTRYRPLALGLLLLPWCLPGVVTARTFEWLYHPTAGVVPRLVPGASVNWLGDPALALVALVIADVWRTMPFVALLCYARLRTIPRSVYEAADVDGAGRALTFRAITLPLVLPVLMVAALFRTLDALRVFDLPFVLTGGGPASATETLTVSAYRAFFSMQELGVGAAIACVVFAIVVGTAVAYLVAVERLETS